MRIQTFTATTSHTHQRGAVLAVSLIILLVLTLIGISSMDGSIMEEKMAANAQISTTTFQEADSAVRQTYYQENLHVSKKRTAAVNKARNATLGARTTDLSALVQSRNHNPYDITSNTVIQYPGRATPLYNSSSGFVAHGIEVVGTASVDNITSTSRQGYSIYPMRP